AHSGVFTGDRRCELIDYAVAPGGGRDLSTDVLAELPVQPDELRVDRLIGAIARGLDEREHLFEFGRPGLRRDGHPASSTASSLPRDPTHLSISAEYADGLRGCRLLLIPATIARVGRRSSKSERLDGRLD